MFSLHKFCITTAIFISSLLKTKIFLKRIIYHIFEYLIYSYLENLEQLTGKPGTVMEFGFNNA